ncbi:MAG: hypothetical protein WCA47_00150 [Terriglobales bacterium]
MNTLLGLLDEIPSPAEQPRATPIRDRSTRHSASPTALLHTEQIHALVHQLFFQQESKPVRHVGFVAIEACSETATLCLQVAKALAEEDRYDIGLFDAHPDSVPLQTKLQIPSPIGAELTWPIAPRLWLVPRQSWLPQGSAQRITEQNLSRLREIMTEFDFSILSCAPASWLTACIGQTCDGLVLVLTANKTRRLVAAQIKDHLTKARVPLLGTVLADRRFPVPQGLYRSL